MIAEPTVAFQIVLVALGILLLIMGRKLFWLFVGAVGFAAGLKAAEIFFGPQPFWVLWACGLVLGIIGALLALFFQHVAIVLGGFIAGATIALYLLPASDHHAVALGGFFVGGLIGAAALFLLFDWALVFLSSMVGATLIIEHLGRQLPFGHLLYLVLIAIGVGVQAKWLLASQKQ